ncbi:MAG: hypothetical protein ACRDTE_14000, partial [Pseudonocardiaceae bacterium]
RADVRAHRDGGSGRRAALHLLVVRRRGTLDRGTLRAVPRPAPRCGRALPERAVPYCPFVSRATRSFCRTRVHHPHTRTTRDGVLIEACDGSHAEVITDPELDARRPVIQAGPRPLWDSVEATYQLWCHLDRPHPGRFGVVANPTTQFVWFDTDEGWYRWPLPLT